MQKANLKLNKDKYLFRCTSIPFFFFYGEIISSHGVSHNPTKVQILLNIPPPKSKKELQSLLDILKYLHKFLTIDY